MLEKTELTERLRGLFAEKDFQSLKAAVRSADRLELAAAWLSLAPIEKAACFKLIDEPKDALAFYRTLPYEERYFLLGAYDLGAIAPVLENAPTKVSALFRRLPPEAYDEMIRSLSEGRAEP